MKFNVLKLSVLAFVCLLSMSCVEVEIEASPLGDLKKELPLGSYSSLENDVLLLLNDYRISQNLLPLKRAEIISNISTAHTIYMIDSNELSHDNFMDRNDALIAGANANLVGENVAYGYDTAKSVVDSWIASSTHLAIIKTESYTHFGIAIKADSRGRNYFTNIFIRR